MRVDGATFLLDIDPLVEALSVIRDAHASTGVPGASCREGCGGSWPCVAYAEANGALSEVGE